MSYLLRLFTGNPVLMIYIALAIAAASASVSGYAAWTLNGWRLGGKVERAEADRDRAVTQGKVLADATEACNAGVKRVENLAIAAVTNSKAMLEEAKKLNAGGLKTAARMEELLKQPTPAGADCNAAWQEIEKARTP